MIEAAVAVTAKMVTAAAVMMAAEGTAMTMMAVAVMAKTAAVTEMAAAVMTMAEKAVADGNDGKGSSRQRGCWFISSVSEVRIIWNITPAIVHESHEGNLDLQKKSVMNKNEYKNKTYWDADGSSFVAFLFPCD
jgi:hypothetical protein